MRVSARPRRSWRMESADRVRCPSGEAGVTRKRSATPRRNEASDGSGQHSRDRKVRLDGEAELRPERWASTRRHAEFEYSHQLCGGADRRQASLLEAAFAPFSTVVFYGRGLFREQRSAKLRNAMQPTKLVRPREKASCDKPCKTGKFCAKMPFTIMSPLL